MEHDVNAISNVSCQNGPVVARVIETLSHPNAEHIRLAIVDAGNGIKRRIVYGGARELRAGQLVPACLPGARLPNGVKMRSRRYRGEMSYGMLCSTDELGWTINGPDEVAVLKQELAVGTSLCDVVNPFDLLAP